MLALDELRKVFETEAVATAAEHAPVPFKICDEPFDQPDDGLWVHFWYELGTTEQIDLGSRRSFERTPGVLQFTVFNPEKSGMGAASRLAAAIKKRWNRREWLVGEAGYVQLDPMSTKPSGKVYGGFKPIACDAQFFFTHRDPDAADYGPISAP